MKRKVLTGLAALTLLDVSAELAEAQNWAGGYVGGHLGARWGSADVTSPAFTFVSPLDPGGIFTSPARTERYDPGSLIGGAHLGYNFLLQSVLVGIEADISAGSADDTRVTGFLSSDGVVAQRTATVKLGWQGTIRGRVGYAFADYLVYATGGVAFTSFKWSDTIIVSPPFTAVFGASASDTLTGWTIGAGVERALTPTLLARIQYLYEDFGKTTVPLAATALPGSVSVTVHKFVFGVSYKF